MKRQLGLTFVELLTVLVIISILASIAIPSYRTYVQRSDRSAAKSALMENAQFMERNFTAANRYDKDAAANDMDSSKLPVQSAPKGDTSPKYNITLDSVSATQFTLKATPAGSQAGDDCGAFTLTNSGVKNVEGATLDTDHCWNR